MTMNKHLCTFCFFSSIAVLSDLHLFCNTSVLVFNAFNKIYIYIYNYVWLVLLVGIDKNNGFPNCHWINNVTTAYPSNTGNISIGMYKTISTINSLLCADIDSLELMATTIDLNTHKMYKKFEFGKGSRDCNKKKGNK